MSYESHALRKARSEADHIRGLVRRGTATRFQRHRLLRLLDEYGDDLTASGADDSARRAAAAAQRACRVER